MKFRWLMVFALGAAVVKPASSQVSVYANMSASKLTNDTDSFVLYGPTIGVTARVVSKPRLSFYGDIRGEFYGSARRMDGVAIGPKVGFPLKKFEPYAELLVGFARYNDGLGTRNSGTTDAHVEANFGVDRQVTPRFDWRIFEFGYQQFYALGGTYNPKTFSTGVVYHVGKR